MMWPPLGFTTSVGVVIFRGERVTNLVQVQGHAKGHVKAATGQEKLS